MSKLNKNKEELFNFLREEYSQFIYKNYEIIEEENKYIINYYYSLDEKVEFVNKILINKKEFKFKNDINSKCSKNVIFNIGLVEAISYYKLTCSKIFLIKCGSIDEWQKLWWAKLIYNGLGELRYKNGFAEILLNDFVKIICDNEKKMYEKKDFEEVENCTFFGNLVPIGGGKDSIVTLELLHQYDNIPYMFFHKRKASFDTCYTYGFSDNNIFEIDRILDNKLFELNEQGYINGHVPMSAMIAFTSYLTALLLGKKYIVLSNEASSNEGNIEGTNINHQYSKSFEFEKDFNEYIEKYFITQIKYFSLLRPISEYQIAKQLVKYEKYLKVFRSCNQGLKDNLWCGKCAKCIFVYCLLISLLGRVKTNEIFNKDILNDISLEEDFRKLIGLEIEKPFECVGTKDEVIYSLKKFINNTKGQDLPELLKKYDKYISEYTIKCNYDELYNKENFVPIEYEDIIKI